jgi:hypothetical protein
MGMTAKLMAVLGLDGSSFNANIDAAKVRTQGFNQQLGQTNGAMTGAFGSNGFRAMKEMVVSLARGEMSLGTFLQATHGLGAAFGGLAASVGIIALIGAGIYAAGKAMGSLAGKVYEWMHPIETYSINARAVIKAVEKSVKKLNEASLATLREEIKSIEEEFRRLSVYSEQAHRDIEKWQAVGAETRKLRIKEQYPEGPDRDRAIAEEESLEKTLKLETERIALASKLTNAQREQKRLTEQSEGLEQRDIKNKEELRVASDNMEGGGSEQEIARDAAARFEQAEIAKERDMVEEKVRRNQEALDIIADDQKVAAETRSQQEQNIEKDKAQKIAEIDRKEAEKAQKEQTESDLREIEKQKEVEKAQTESDLREIEKQKEVEKKRAREDREKDRIEARGAEEENEIRMGGHGGALGPIKLGTAGGLQSIGGYFASKGAVQGAQQSRAEQTQDKILRVQEEMARNIAKLADETGE